MDEERLVCFLTVADTFALRCDFQQLDCSVDWISKHKPFRRSSRTVYFRQPRIKGLSCLLTVGIRFWLALHLAFSFLVATYLVVAESPFA